MGQKVWVCLTAELHGQQLSKWCEFYIFEIKAYGGSEKTEYSYVVGENFPSAYYDPKHRIQIKEEDIQTEKPDGTNP